VVDQLEQQWQETPEEIGEHTGSETLLVGGVRGGSDRRHGARSPANAGTLEAASIAAGPSRPPIRVFDRPGDKR
jgi:hypothetical protein